MPRASVRKSARVARERRTAYTPQSPFKRVTRRQINAVVQKIVDEFKPEKIILFGSYAYGKPTIDSDVDMLVVMESNEQPTRRAIKIVRSLLDVPFPMDVLVRTPQEITHRLNVEDYFMREIVQQGRVLYER
jgi:predicted nucleotidyltransferase